VNTRSILYFLAIGVLSSTPALGDKLSSQSMEQGENSVSVHELSKGNAGNNAILGHSMGPSASNESTFTSQLKDFDEGGRVSILQGLISSKPDSDGKSWKFPEIGSTHGEEFGKIDHKDFGKHHKVLVGDGPPPASVPEPRSLTLLLLGMGALGALLYRRNLL
jgi:hypothetical protein